MPFKNPVPKQKGQPQNNEGKPGIYEWKAQDGKGECCKVNGLNAAGGIPANKEKHYFSDTITIHQAYEED